MKPVIGLACFARVVQTDKGTHCIIDREKISIDQSKFSGTQMNNISCLSNTPEVRNDRSIIVDMNPFLGGHHPISMVFRAGGPRNIAGSR